MFTSSKIIPDTVTNKSNKIDTIIGALTTIQGNMSGSGTIRVDGKYNGDICTETDVIIGETGSVTGNITSANVTISGIVEGNMKCSELLEILPTGQLIGDIEAKNISINTGAIFKGKCSMNTKETTVQEVNENIQETVSQ